MASKFLHTVRSIEIDLDRDQAKVSDLVRKRKLCGLCDAVINLCRYLSLLGDELFKINAKNRDHFLERSFENVLVARCFFLLQ